jgi:energy-coupling factor transport system ATP-binding protein
LPIIRHARADAGRDLAYCRHRASGPRAADRGVARARRGAFGLENLGLPVAEIRARAEATLEELNLLHLAGRETFTLSGGEKQKLAAAGVLALQPKVLLLDEPLANLDPASAAETLALCRRLADTGRSVVIVEHRVEEALSIAPDVVVLMEAGRITYQGSAEGAGAFADPRAVK